MSLESRCFEYGRVFDHWQIDRRLDRGVGKTAVFSMTHTNASSIRSALKVISLIECDGSEAPEDYRTALEQAKSFAEQEVMLMSDLQGRTNIVDYLDHTFLDWKDGNAFGCDMLIRMELLTDLRGIIKKRNFSDEEVIKIGCDICNALILCHKKNILHRDIKPENIFVNKDENYKLGDFGISRILSAAPMAAASTGIGTPQYWAPEQVSGRYDNRVDLYSLGIVLYELRNRCRLPFAETSFVRQDEIARRLSGETLPAPAEASPRLARVILKACAYRPEDRYQTAAEFLAALQSLTRPAWQAPMSAPGDDCAAHSFPAETADYATELARPGKADAEEKKSNDGTAPDLHAGFAGSRPEIRFRPTYSGPNPASDIRIGFAGADPVRELHKSYVNLYAAPESRPFDSVPEEPREDANPTAWNDPFHTARQSAASPWTDPFRSAREAYEKMGTEEDKK